MVGNVLFLYSKLYFLFQIRQKLSRIEDIVREWSAKIKERCRELGCNRKGFTSRQAGLQQKHPVRKIE